MAKEKNKLKPVNAPAYRYWSALYMSFFSPRIYVDAGKRWRGFGVLYLLLVVFICAIPLSLKISGEFNKAFNQQLMEPLLKLPTIYIQNGELVFDKPMPYEIRNDKNQVVIVIDSTGKVDKFSEEYPYLNILINKNVINFKLPTPALFGINEQEVARGVSIVQPFEKGANMVFDGKKIVKDNAISGLKYASQLMIYPIVVSVLFGVLAVILLVIAFLGQVFARIFFSFAVTFPQSSRLMMIAATPMILVLSISLTLNVIFPGFGIILLALLALYYSFAIRSLRAESKMVVK